MSRCVAQRAAIRRLTEALVASRPVAEIQQLVVEEACSVTQAASAAIGLLTASEEFLDIVAAAGENALEVVGLRTRLADSLSASVIATGEALLLDGAILVDTEDLFATAAAHCSGGSRDASTPSLTGLPRPQSKLRAGRSAAVVPIRAESRLLGTLTVLNRSENSEDCSFDTDDLDTLAILANYAALAYKVDWTTRGARAQARELAVLHDAAATVSRSLDARQVMEGVLTALCSHLEHGSAALFLLNDEETHLTVASQRGLDDDRREIQLAVGSGLAARVLQTGEPLLVQDAGDEADDSAPWGAGIARSVMMAPLHGRDNIHGILLVTAVERGAYDAEDLNLVTAVAAQAGIALENAWLYGEAERRAAEAGALFELSCRVSEARNVNQILNYAADTGLQLLHSDGFAVLLYDHATDRLEAKLTRGIDPEAFSQSPTRPGLGISGWVFEWQTPQAVSDVAADQRNASAPIDPVAVASTLCVPMQAGDEVIGVIHATSGKRRLFTVAEMELLYTVANVAANAVASR